MQVTAVAVGTFESRGSQSPHFYPQASRDDAEAAVAGWEAEPNGPAGQRSDPAYVPGTGFVGGI